MPTDIGSGIGETVSPSFSMYYFYFAHARDNKKSRGKGFIMQIRFYYNAGGFPNITLREVSENEYQIDLQQDPDKCEADLTTLLMSVRESDVDPAIQLFAVTGVGEERQIIGAEMIQDHAIQKPRMKYLKQSATHQVSDALRTRYSGPA